MVYDDVSDDLLYCDEMTSVSCPSGLYWRFFESLDLGWFDDVLITNLNNPDLGFIHGVL